jgi:hypothetical protein
MLFKGLTIGITIRHRLRRISAANGGQFAA